MEKLKLNPETYGIEPNTGLDLCRNFQALFKDIAKAGEEVLVELRQGIYDIFYNDSIKKVDFMTNTLGEDEVKNPIHSYALYFKGINNFELNGNNATILLHGNMTNMCLEDCSCVTVRNLTIDHKRPTLSQVEVIKKGVFHSVLKIHPDSLYRINTKKLLFFGDNWERYADKDTHVWHTILRPAREKERLVRTHKHPFFAAYKVTELEKNLVKVKYCFPTRIKTGEVYSLSDSTRYEVGVFISRSKNITFNNFRQHYNHSMGIDAQCCENLNFENVVFAPKEGSERVVVSHTDFLHFNMCRGNISIIDSRFEGANDDCINVHGVFLKVVSKNSREVVVKFCEHQTYGFNPLDIGDKIRFVNRLDLFPIEKSERMIVESELLEDKHTIRLVFDENLPKKVKCGCLLEDMDAYPELLFSGNFLSMITARGVLITTPKHAEISGNTFKNIAMSGVFVSCDGRSWYESGAVCDLTVKNNEFINCRANGILIRPENRLKHGAVHKNITIENNSFVLNGGRAIDICDSENVIIKDNVILGKVKKSSVKIKN